MPLVVFADVQPKSHIGVFGIDFESNIELQYGYTDNLTYQRDNDFIESDFVALKPIINAIGQRDNSRYGLLYAGDYRVYDASSGDDYQDHYFAFNGLWELPFEQGLSVHVSDSIGHEERGRGLTEGFTDQQFERWGVNHVLQTNMLVAELGYYLGSPKSKNKLNLSLSNKQLEFIHVDPQIDAVFQNYIKEEEWSESTVVSELFSQLSDDTRLRFSFIGNFRHYQQQTDKNSNEFFFGSGIKSKRTGKTQIDAYVAWLIKTFPNNKQAKTFRGFNWNVALKWQPKRHSTFKLYTSYNIKDPTEAKGYILSSVYGINWQHYWWTSRFSSTVGYSYTEDDFKQQSSDRLDKRDQAYFKINYDFRKSVMLELSYTQDLTTSNQDKDNFEVGDDKQIIFRTLGYQQSLIMFTVKVQI